MKKYLTYKPEDFVTDNEFIQWVISPDESSNKKWNELIRQYPVLKESIDHAVLIVRSFNPVEEDVSSERISLLWRRILESRKKRKQQLYSNLVKYAAIIIVTFALGWGGSRFISSRSDKYAETYNEIIVPYGERSHVILYDGTSVWLNSGTKLKFPLVFNGDQRNVYIDGEAFFNVSKNTQMPFIVHAAQMEVIVTGTRFNVCAYSGDENFYTTLEEGTVFVSNVATHKKYKLLPGEQAVLNLSSQKITHDSVNTDLYTSWKENQLKLENAKFAEVIKKMERWYDIKIIVENPDNFNKSYTMTIKTESLSEMLKLLSYTTPLKYKIDGENVIIY